LNNVQEEVNIGGVSGLLFNYAIGSATMRYEHKLWLDQMAIPFLKQNRDRTVSLFGLASRSGSDDFNRKLSQWRAEKIHAYLRSRGVNKDQFEDDTAMGEQLAADFGEADGTEDMMFRAVQVFLFFADDE
jgi:outer membrane protein OmpA-like peptidoglycan-associated protein